MRIQHNIMAMNAYRNYNTNTSALSKNLEKLSSGYKINRAGDDAAGLAISEKMRAQITGLNAAQKNVKDGVSLVKTAEGAMQEIQDMLNRMDYLATQSANGTYDSSVDRTNLQKEVNALRDEINRIADSANFNGIKLLDGTQAGVKAQAAYTETIEGATFTGNDRILKPDIGADGTPVKNNGNIVFDSYSPAATAGSFKIDFSDVKFSYTLGSNAAAATGAASFAVGSASVAFGTLKVTIGDTTFDIKASSFGSGIKISASKGVIKATGGIKASAIAKAVINAIASKCGVGSGIATKGANGSIACGSEVTVKFNDVLWTVKASTSGAITFTQKAPPKSAEEARLDFKVNLQYTPSTASVPASGVKVDLSKDGSLQDGTIVTKKAIPEGASKKAEAVFQLKNSDIVDGAKITIGENTYTIKLGPDSKVTTSDNGTNYVIDLSNYKAGDPDLLHKALASISSKSSTVTLKCGKGNENVTFKLSVRDDGIAIKRQSAAASAGKVYFKKAEDFDKYFGLTYADTSIEHDAVLESGGLKLQIGDTSDSFNQMGVHIGDMHVKAMGFDLDSKGEITQTGKSIADIDISTQDGAAEAIQTIKNAINYVSGIRGDLGAVQNRLEHTQNNLSVMAENIQDAESTIRDTDVADEMMSYVKNNILVQSAQAMLAQANQVPQGVLQLLG